MDQRKKRSLNWFGLNELTPPEDTSFLVGKKKKNMRENNKKCDVPVARVDVRGDAHPQIAQMIQGEGAGHELKTPVHQV